MKKNEYDVGVDQTGRKLKESEIPRMFWMACGLIQSADMATFRLREIGDIDPAQRPVLEEQIERNLNKANQLVDHYRRHLSLHPDSVIALYALVFALSNTPERLKDDQALKTAEAVMMQWLSATPESDLRIEIEYLLRRRLVLQFGVGPGCVRYLRDIST